MLAATRRCRSRSGPPRSRQAALFNKRRCCGAHCQEKRPSRVEPHALRRPRADSGQIDYPKFVIPGLVPGIHVDGRDKPGHDGEGRRFYVGETRSSRNMRIAPYRFAASVMPTYSQVKASALCRASTAAIVSVT